MDDKPSIQDVFEIVNERDRLLAQVKELQVQRDWMMGLLAGWIAMYGSWVRPNTAGVQLLQSTRAAIKHASTDAEARRERA